jgi:hypothetical protein
MPCQGVKKFKGRYMVNGEQLAQRAERRGQGETDLQKKSPTPLARRFLAGIGTNEH